MKKRLLSLLLAAALTAPCLYTSAAGFEVEGEQISISDGTIIGLDVYDENGAMVTIDVYDEQGNQLYEQVGFHEWEKLETPIPAAELERREAEKRAALKPVISLKKAGIEQVYHVKLTDDWLGDTEDKLEALTDLENALLGIPAPLREAVDAQLAKRGKTLTIGRCPDPDDSALEWQSGIYYPDLTRIEISGIEHSFAHEYGHLVGRTVLPYLYGSSTLKSMWTAQNEGAVYGERNFDDPAFVTKYASTNYNEDFAETFQRVLMQGEEQDREEVLRLTYEHPDSVAVKKLAYMRQLLCEAFSLDPSIFPDTAVPPAHPSEWARAGVEEYQQMLGASDWNSVIPSGGYARWDYSYQAGTTRGCFAYSMYSDVVSKLKSASCIDQEEYDEKWNTLGERWVMFWNGACPFSDIGYDEVSHYVRDDQRAIYFLYQNGVVTGTSETTFSPDGLITRQEAAVMLYRLCQALNYELPQGDADFADADQIAPWAKEAVSAVAAAGIMNGVGGDRFDPTGVYSGEQSALTLLRVYKLLAAAAQE